MFFIPNTNFWNGSKKGSDAFIFKIKGNSITLPAASNGVYNYDVDWGDGTSDTNITTWNAPAATHVYANTDEYTITITGVFKGWRVANNADRTKYTEIINWGNIGLHTTSGAWFQGCENLIVTATDVPDVSDVTTCLRGFRDCKELTTIPNFDKWNFSNVTILNEMFRYCDLYNDPGVSNLHLPKVERALYVFEQNYGQPSAFNQPINWYAPNLENLNSCLRNAISFNQPLGNLNIESVTNMSVMLLGANNWSTENYDSTLIAWALQQVQSGVRFDCSTKYTAGGAAEAARNYLVNTKNWTINDNGAL